MLTSSDRLNSRPSLKENRFTSLSACCRSDEDNCPLSHTQRPPPVWLMERSPRRCSPPQPPWCDPPREQRRRLRRGAGLGVLNGAERAPLRHGHEKRRNPRRRTGEREEANGQQTNVARPDFPHAKETDGDVQSGEDVTESEDEQALAQSSRKEIQPAVCVEKTWQL
ncbi:hypothetical protein MHYP_G00323310 [Metynnis hypsauchen]